MKCKIRRYTFCSAPAENSNWNYVVGALKMTVKHCCHSHSTCRKVPPNLIHKGMTAPCVITDELWGHLEIKQVEYFQWMLGEP